MATGPRILPESPVQSAELPSKREGRWRGLARWIVGGAHSKAGVWLVIAALVVVLTVVTIGFVQFGWTVKFIPLYEADAEVAIVAAALYAIAVEWKGGVSGGK